MLATLISELAGAARLLVAFARDLPCGERLLIAVFQSVTARTASFGTIDIGALSTRP
jgi:Trk-type K+ transport system membrane component